jgi:very-short-patch-repair endonuclease
MRLLDPATDIEKSRIFRYMKIQRELEERWGVGRESKDRWQIIRDAYKLLLPAIMEAGEKGGAVCPYILEWDFTPIERMAWMDIRGMGLPLFPQFPVGRVFIDFADPYRKIGVELDGAAYHERERDLARDEKLKLQGWKIFRIPGRVANKIIENPFESSETPRLSSEFREKVFHWALNDSSGFFWALKEYFYRKTPSHKSWAYDVLARYQLADFHIEDCE